MLRIPCTLVGLVALCSSVLTQAGGINGCKTATADKTTGKMQCTECNLGFYATPPSCSSCSKGCNICVTGTLCTTCGDGFFKTTASCTNCLSECKVCNSTTTCTTCNTGYSVSKDSKGVITCAGSGLMTGLIIGGVVALLAVFACCFGCYSKWDSVKECYYKIMGKDNGGGGYSQPSEEPTGRSSFMGQPEGPSVPAPGHNGGGKCKRRGSRSRSRSRSKSPKGHKHGHHKHRGGSKSRSNSPKGHGHHGHGHGHKHGHKK